MCLSKCAGIFSPRFVYPEPCRVPDVSPSLSFFNPTNRETVSLLSVDVKASVFFMHAGRIFLLAENRFL